MSKKTKRIIPIALLSLLIAGCASNKTDELKPKVNDKNATTIEMFNNRADYKLEPINFWLINFFRCYEKYLFILYSAKSLSLIPKLADINR